MAGDNQATKVDFERSASPKVWAEIDNLEQLYARNSGLLDKMRRVLLNAADQCDAWADQSEKGGWSTHQVRAQREYANQLRREAMKQ